jgi:hypothetical protein
VKTSTDKSNVVTQILLSAVAIALGYLLLFDKTMQLLTLCRILCGGLVVVGVVSIISFFVSGDYKRIDRYGFTLGVLLAILGVIGFLRMNELTANFEVFAGLLALVLSILTLQGTVQVKILDYAVWVLSLLLAVICLAGSFCVMAGITPITKLVGGFAHWILLISGGSCLFSLIVTWICILLAARREKKAMKEAEEIAQAVMHGDYQEIPPAQAADTTAEPSYKPSEPAETFHTDFTPASDVPSADPSVPDVPSAGSSVPDVPDVTEGST